MCGIIGYLGSRNAVPVLLDGLKKLEYRGYDSAGVAIVRDNKILVRRVKGKIRDLDESLKASPLEGHCGLGHTRWATHGRPSEENAHPHRDCSGSLSSSITASSKTIFRSRKGSSVRGISSARRRTPRSLPIWWKSISGALSRRP
jgi:glucosamine--fructose-6-phosphate aminotransferase (isomerizing)